MNELGTAIYHPREPKTVEEFVTRAYNIYNIEMNMLNCGVQGHLIESLLNMVKKLRIGASLLIITQVKNQGQYM